MENPIQTGSGDPGSPGAPATKPDQGAPAGQAQPTGGAEGKGAYEELQQRLGEQGQELGEYRQFFKNISPLLDRLDQAPELVQAIIDGKVDKVLAKAALEGRIDVRDAAAVQQAHDQVKSDLGKKAYEAANPDEVNKLVAAQVEKFRREFEEDRDLKEFQKYTQDFIAKTPDFQEHAEEIDKWLDTHEVADIEVAYYAVKGKMSEEAAKKVAEAAAADRAKDVVSNASGGGQTVTAKADGRSLVDQLIAGKPNPNSFFS